MTGKTKTSRNQREGRFGGKALGRRWRHGDAAARQRRVDDFIKFLDDLNIRWPKTLEMAQTTDGGEP